MSTKLFTIAIFTMLLANAASAQNTTIVNATNSDISDNLDLRAVASIFGQARNLDDFESRLNNPREQISNLDLNNDGNVDYLRVIESVENRTHLIVIQAVLAKDVFQDVAIVEVQKDNNNQVQVQVVGDVFMYGQNYIYEPIYNLRPQIYASFWSGNYNPYFSPYYWNYYPDYYSYWNPYPVFRYRRNVNVFINLDNTYNYVNIRRCQDQYSMYSSRRANGYEAMHPNRSFSQRNDNLTNRYELDRGRNLVATRSENNNVRTVNGTSREQINSENTVRNYGTRTNNNETVRNNTFNQRPKESATMSTIGSIANGREVVNRNQTREFEAATTPNINATSKVLENGSDVNFRNSSSEIENEAIPVRNPNRNTNSAPRNNIGRTMEASGNSNSLPATKRSEERSNYNQQRAETSESSGRGR